MLDGIGWVQCDGPAMRVVGSWEGVVEMCENGKSRPVDAIYAAVSSAPTPAPSAGCPTEQPAISATKSEPQGQQQQQQQDQEEQQQQQQDQEEQQQQQQQDQEEQQQEQPIRIGKKGKWKKLKSFVHTQIRKLMCCGDASC